MGRRGAGQPYGWAVESAVTRSVALPPGGAEEVARVARAMLSELDDVLQTIGGRVWQTVPGYSQFLPDRKELNSRIRESVLNIVTCLLEWRGPTPAELERSARTGERRALQGVASMAMIQSFRTAERVLLEELQGWCTRMQVRAATARACRAALLHDLDSLEKAMLDAYTELQIQIEADRRLSEPRLFRRLAAGVPIDTTELEELAIAIGVADPDRTEFVTAAARLGPATDGAPVDRVTADQVRHRVVTELARSLGSTVLSGVVEDAGQPVVLVAVPWHLEPEALLLDLSRALAPISESSITTGIGERCTGLATLGTSCRQALAAAAVVGEPGGVHLYADTLLEIMVRREASMARQLIDRYLGELTPELLTTLRTHLDQRLSLRATAAVLGVHKNTVSYRLRRIEELSGLDLRRPRDLSRLVVALEAADQLSAGPPAALQP